MTLYDPEFIKSLPRLSPGLPAMVYVAKGASPSRAYFKGLLEGWYENIPEHCKPNVYHNLRSLDDKEFKSQLFELAVFTSLKKEGEAEYNPVLPNNKTPDILLSRADVFLLS